jgi:hypothetical protein
MRWGWLLVVPYSGTGKTVEKSSNTDAVHSFINQGGRPMQRLYRVLHQRHSAGELRLLENKLVPAASPVEALFIASGNSMPFESTFLSTNSATVERIVDGMKDIWQAIHVNDGATP